MLGFKSAIARNADEAWGALCDLRSAMDNILKLEIEDISSNLIIADRIRAFIFSDSVLVFTYSNQPEDLKAILILTTQLFSKSLASCVPLRGGISVGRFRFNEELNLFCGTPFVEAYQISERAQWSGIVVSDSVAENYFNEPDRITSAGHPVLVEWNVSVKTSNKVRQWVINWPHVFQNSFGKPAPITSEEFYRAFESLFGPYEDLREDARIKYDNTVEFINWALVP